MLILAVDTSGKDGSLALVRFEAAEDHGRSLLGLKPTEQEVATGTAGSRALPTALKKHSVSPRNPEVLEIVALEGGTFSAQLIPQISALLLKHSLPKNDIDAFAVASGPGSFTGLRVGLAAVKALAEVLKKPIASVSLLEIVARCGEKGGPVIAALDAGRGEVYVGIYECRDHASSAVAEELLTFDEFRSRASVSRVVTPDRKLAERLKEGNINVTTIPQPRADAVARLGLEKIKNGEVFSPEALDATYIRRTDAEIMRSSRVPR